MTCRNGSENCRSPAADSGTTKRAIYGVELRYVPTFHLSQYGRATISELLEALDYYNFTVAGTPSKSISDALRWEIAHGRVRRLRRGQYGPGVMPRSTEDRIRKRVLVLRAEADKLGGVDVDAWWDALRG